MVEPLRNIGSDGIEEGPGSVVMVVGESEVGVGVGGSVVMEISCGMLDVTTGVVVEGAVIMSPSDVSTGIVVGGSIKNDSLDVITVVSLGPFKRQAHDRLLALPILQRLVQFNTQILNLCLGLRTHTH